MDVSVVDREQCLRLLAGDEVGRLAVIAGTTPAIFPVNYALDGDTIVFRTDPGTKLAHGPRARASFEVDSFDRDRRAGWSVVASGRLEEVTRYDAAVFDRVRGLSIEPWAGGDKEHWMRLVPDRVTGRRIGPPGRGNRRADGADERPSPQTGVGQRGGILPAHSKEVAMALMRRERFDFPEWFRFEVPDVFRRMADLDPQSGWLRVEEFVDNGTLVVRAELPDIDPDKDVELSVADGVLHIRAQREEKTEKKDKDVYRSEFRYGSFVRNIPLPEGVKEDDISASYKDGILEIRAPIATDEEKPQVTKVPIARG